MKVAILYVCTGRYALFWKDFFVSSEKYFLCGHEKEYFVFTDETLEEFCNSTVHIIPQKNLGWPDNTLLRYHMFREIADLLSEFDYCCFLNSNAEFCAPVGDEFLPADGKMLFVQHPGFFEASADKFTYERNPKSRAYIPQGEGDVYVCGGINCARTATYISFMNNIIAAVDEDKKRGIIALWHDESYSNRYALDNPYTLLGPAYCYPEGWALPFSPKIRIRDKSLHGGHAYLRGDVEQPTFRKIPHVTTVLMGGLGNQMFQYAAGCNLAFRLNAKLMLDLSWFSQQRMENETPRCFALNCFPFISERILSGAITIRQTSSSSSSSSSLLERIKEKFFSNQCDKVRKVSEKEVPDGAAFRRLTAPQLLVGYWQNEAYFLDAATLVKQFFSFPPLQAAGQALANNIADNKNSVSVHVRRGDYANNMHTKAFHGLCSSEYYSSAINYVKKRHVQDIRLYIFSDDPAWVHNNFDPLDLPFTVVDLHSNNEAFHDMHLMSLCRHHIIANSSFSWWGAWLSSNCGIKIAPKRWFVDPSMAHFNPCPSNWFRL